MTIVQSEDICDPKWINGTDMVIMIMGQTGTGKSNIIDTLTGHKGERAGDAADLQPKTMQVNAVRIKGHPIYKNQLVLIDTPGFKDPFSDSDLEVVAQIKTWLLNMDVFPHGILYLHRINDNRMNGAQHQTSRLFREMCGVEFMDRTVFVSTMWDLESAEIGENREEELIRFWKAIFSEITVKRYLNTLDSAWDIVDTVLGMPPNDRTPLQLQKDLECSEDFEHSAILILLLGNTGCGKSTFINQASMTSLANVNRDLTSVDQTVRSFVVSHLRKPSLSIIFVEPPGFDHLEKSDKDVLSLIVNWLKDFSKPGVCFGGVIYLQDITQSRLQGSTIYGLHILSLLSRPDPAGHIVITTTKWKNIQCAEHKRREVELKGLISRNFSVVADKPILRFLNTADSAWAVIDTLLRNKPLKVEVIKRDLIRLGDSASRPKNSRPVWKWKSFFASLFGFKSK